MSTNPPDSTQPEQPTGSTELMTVAAPPTEPTLAEEFREFGRTLSALLHVVRESPRAKEVETQVTQAMREMERQVNEALATAREKARSQDWKETIKGAANTAADETQRGLARGLHTLNERMAKAVEEAEQKRASTAGPGDTGSNEGPTA